MEQSNNPTGLHNNKELTHLHNSYSKQSREELDSRYDVIVEEMESMELNLSKKEALPLIKLLESENLFNLPFVLSRGFLDLHKVLKSGEPIGIGLYRVFQKVFTNTTFSNIEGARILHETLEVTKPFNLRIARLEEELKIVATYSSRAEIAKESGLEFKEGDNEARLEIEK